MKKYLLIALFLLMPGLMLADGILIPPENYFIQETDQKAAIFYEKDESIETMVVSIKYQGNAQDFAWIIPVPSEPEVSRGSYTLFDELSKKTVVTTSVSYDSDLSLGSTESMDIKSTPVTVVETKTIDYYDITVLQSTDKEALVNWLNENNYQYPTEKAYIFNDYINNGWYFVAMKINPDYSSADVASSLTSGSATPVQLAFNTKNIVFPLRLSAVTAETNLSEPPSDFFELQPTVVQKKSNTYKQTSVPITLYVIADHKKQASNFSIQYADKMKKKDIEKLANTTNGDPWVAPEKRTYYLTKLYGNISYSQMNEDLFIQDASDNKAVNVKKWYSNLSLGNFARFILYVLLFVTICLIIAIFSPLGLFFCYLYFRKSALKTIHKVLMWVDYGLMVLVLLSLQMIAMEGNIYNHLDNFWYKYNLTENAMLVSAWLVALFILIIVPIMNVKRIKKQ